MQRRRALFGLAAWPLGAAAQADRPVTIVVPYAPGGTTDLLGRLLAREMGALLGRTMVVENKPGAGSGLGASFVARAPADGNTLLVATSTTLAINPWLYRRLSYDPLRDFAPVGMIGAVPLLAVVHPSVPASNLRELVALSKSQPERLSYGSAGNGSPQHLAVEMLKAATGASLTHVPYRGSAPAVGDLLAGQIQVMLSDIPPVLPHVRTGRLRALAVTSAQRQPAIQEVAPIAESGVPGTNGFLAMAWQSLVAPAGTPEDVVAQYANALARVMNQRAIRARLLAEGFEPATMPPRALAAYIRSETARWGEVVKAAGMTPE